MLLFCANGVAGVDFAESDRLPPPANAMVWFGVIA